MPFHTSQKTSHQDHLGHRWLLHVLRLAGCMLPDQTEVNHKSIGEDAIIVKDDQCHEKGFSFNIDKCELRSELHNGSRLRSTLWVCPGVLCRGTGGRD